MSPADWGGLYFREDRAASTPSSARRCATWFARGDARDLPYDHMFANLFMIICEGHQGEEETEAGRMPHEPNVAENLHGYHEELQRPPKCRNGAELTASLGGPPPILRHSLREMVKLQPLV